MTFSSHENLLSSTAISDPQGYSERPSGLPRTQEPSLSIVTPIGTMRIAVLSLIGLAALCHAAEDALSPETLPSHPNVLGFPRRPEYDAVGGAGCGCYHPAGKLSENCGCCFMWWIPIVENQMVCNNITAVPGQLKVMVSVSIGGTKIINGGVDLGNPKPICSNPAQTLGFKVCWSLYDIHFTSSGFTVCSKLFVKWTFFNLWELDLGCLDLVGDQGNQWQCETETLDGVTSCTSTCDGVQGRTESIQGREGALFMEYDHHEGELDGRRRELVPVEVRDNTYYHNGCQVGSRPTIKYNYKD